MERVLNSSHPDPLDIDKAKKVLKVGHSSPLAACYGLCFLNILSLTCEDIYNSFWSWQEHEEALMDAIERLVEASEGESGK